MKLILACTVIGVVSLAAGFVSGRVFQHVTGGYHFEVHEEKEYASAIGPVHWSHVTESVGASMLNLGTTMIRLGSRTIYKADRVFQESVPFAGNIQTSGNSIKWDDGLLRFHLTIEEVKKAEPDGSATESQPVRPEANQSESAAGDNR